MDSLFDLWINRGEVLTVVLRKSQVRQNVRRKTYVKAMDINVLFRDS